MAETVIVTVQHTGADVRRDLELPANVPASVLAKAIVESMGWTRNGEPLPESAFEVEGVGISVRPEQTLAEGGVLTGDILILKPHRETGRHPVVEGPALASDTGHVFRLKGDEILIGRSDTSKGLVADVDLTALDVEQSVSRRHAQIHRRQGVYTLQDLKSLNGTWVNDEPVLYGVRKVITHGSRIRIGDVVLTFLTSD